MKPAVFIFLYSLAALAAGIWIRVLHEQAGTVCGTIPFRRCLYWLACWPIALAQALVAPRGWQVAFWTAIAFFRHHRADTHGQDAFCSWCIRCEHDVLLRRRRQCAQCSADAGRFLRRYEGHEDGP